MNLPFLDENTDHNADHNAKPKSWTNNKRKLAEQ